MYISVTQGDTLDMDCIESYGDITGVLVESSVRLGGFTDDLTVTATDLSLGLYTLSSETADWPVGALICDIKYSINGFTSRSETFEIVITKGVTP